MTSDQPGLRQCTACSEWKRERAFARNSQRAGGGLLRRCRTCVNRRQRERYAANPRPRTQVQVDADRRYRAENRDRCRESQRRSKYALAAGEFELRIVEQAGACAVCRQVPGGTLQVDHCHETGMVRGLLCGSCNKAIGLMADDADRLRAAVTYLDSAQGGVRHGADRTGWRVA